MSIKLRLMHYAWDLAYGIYDEIIPQIGLDHIILNMVKNPFKNKWFADPFILREHDTSIEFLVEEFDYSVNRGRIARIVVDKNSNYITECKIILDLPTHLSFPVIYRIEGQVYVHPENSASGTSYIYLYDEEEDRLVNPQMMVNDPITDAIIREQDGLYYMYATKVPSENGNVLYRYQSSNFFGPYNLIGKEVFFNNTARMAGMFINIGDVDIRPAQDCFRDYGRAVIMYNGHKMLCRIIPNSYKFAGIHTFNILDNTFVIDLKRYDFPLFYKFLRKIKK